VHASLNGEYDKEISYNEICDNDDAKEILAVPRFLGNVENNNGVKVGKFEVREIVLLTNSKSFTESIINMFPIGETKAVDGTFAEKTLNEFVASLDEEYLDGTPIYLKAINTKLLVLVTATGLPTILLLPITTQCLPEVSILYLCIKSTIPCGVAEIKHNVSHPESGPDIPCT